ncbi:hypothetical protein [Streptomyces sp. NPDC047315]
MSTTTVAFVSTTGATGATGANGPVIDDVCVEPRSSCPSCAAR